MDPVHVHHEMEIVLVAHQCTTGFLLLQSQHELFQTLEEKLSREEALLQFVVEQSITGHYHHD